MEKNKSAVCMVFSLEPQGNDFISSGQLGFLLIQTMTGCVALNIRRRADERQRKRGGKAVKIVGKRGKKRKK